jgi:divalent metal cation (Fe/Co/Zn/Cd) transporter
LIAIVVEDFAATLGLGIALIGTILANITSNPVFDAVSSIMIGVLLMVSGVFLGYEMKHLITGESISIKKQDMIYNIISGNEKVQEIESLKIISIGANKYLALCKLDYIDTSLDSEIIEINLELKNIICSKFDEITEIYFNPA